MLTPFLIERGLDISVLVILDGGKGLRAAGRKAFRRRAVVQRCLAQAGERGQSGQDRATAGRQRLQRAYHRPEYDEAVASLRQLHRLEDRNQSAARSLTEGDETLTLHRLGPSPSMACRRTLCEGRSLARTRANATGLGRMATALVDIERDGLSSPSGQTS